MPYCSKTELVDYLNFTDPQDPIRAVVCPFAQDAGAGMGLPVFSLLFFGAIGLGLTVRVQHPAPLVVAFVLTAGVAALSLPGAGAQILAIVLFFAIAGVSLYLYQRAQSSL